jgi:Uncharacterised protein family UPF0547
MAEIEQTKVCPHCAETIKAAAKVCPHCRYWQNKWSFRNPHVSVTVYALVYFGFFTGLAIFLGQMFGPKEDFATYRNEISVVDSSFSQRTSQSNLWNTVVGTLTNQSDISWKEVGVEAQFFDKSGKMIDAIPINSYDYQKPTILSHGEIAFKIEGKAARPTADYSTNKVYVRWAKDTRSAF